MVITVSFIVILVLTLLFGFFDGFHGSANLVATVIFSRSMQMHHALLLAAVSAFIGPFLFGVAVAETIGRDLTDPRLITVPVMVAAVLAAIVWKFATAWLGLPSSSSHALIGGLVGAIIANSGLEALRSEGLIKVTVALTISPIVGLVAGYLAMNLTLFLARGATPRINEFFRRGQQLTAIILAMSHGTNNAQKPMGIIALGMIATGLSTTFVVPLWVVASSAAALALGTLFGGRHIIRTLGRGLYKIRPVHGFTSQLAAATIVLLATLLGGPVSTTQTISSTIMGVGSAERLSKVRWGVFYHIGAAWMLSVPVTAVMAAALCALMNGISNSWQA